MSSRGGLPLQDGWLLNVCHREHQRFALRARFLGDAAASFDPLSSLGIGYAMHSGCHAARGIEHYPDKAGSSPLAGYAAAVKQQFATYVPTWRNYYQHEQRFAAAPFWQRRHALAAAQMS